MGIGEPLRIYSLSASVANQIAAGEVIERPASVVKELLENAVDAGADVVNIDIGFGGLNQIKISDNGAGIMAADLSLAIAAHATSKITQLNDLYSITSMGFRGEALASIASVSRLSLSSKPSQQEHAMMIRMDGDVLHIIPCARNQGTTVDVRDLFYNAPVRKRFLKHERAEYQAIEAVVKRFALSAPHVAITLKHNDKLMLTLPLAVTPQRRLQRVQKILGKPFVEGAIHLDTERAGMRLEGWISGLDYQRSQNDKQFIYINQRMIKDKLLAHALKQAYDGLLHPGRHPACLLYLTMPPDQVDVNVHPTKHEVRFQQPRLVHDFMTSQIVDALSIQNRDMHAEERDPVITLQKIEQDDDDVAAAAAAAAAVHYYAPAKTHSSWQLRESRDVSSRYRQQTVLTPRFVVLNAHFVVLFLEDEPWLLNAHLLQHRYSADWLIEQSYPLLSRPLLLPVRFSIDKTQVHVFELLQPVLAELGVQFDFAGDACLLIRTIPQGLPSLNIQELLEALNTINPTLPDVQKSLIESQSFDARQLHDDEKMNLFAYLQNHPDVLTHVGLRLDMTTCQGLIHE